MTNRSDYNPRIWTGGIVLLVCAAAVFPFDGVLSKKAVELASQLGGDLRRELEAWQQFGQFGWIVVSAIALALLQPWRTRRLLDLALAVALTWIVAFGLKLLIGRPRPKFDDPGILLGPFGEYPVSSEAGVRHAWEFWTPISSDLWSMPSSHTAFAVMLSVFLSAMAPRLRPLVIALAATVGVCRVLFGAHYPSDVLVGAAVGWVCAQLVVTHSAGVRGLDWLWVRAVNRDAKPAFPRLIKREAEP